MLLMEKKKILYAEDEELLFRLASRVLDGKYSLEHALDIESALSKAKINDYDAFLCDGLEGKWIQLYDLTRTEDKYQNSPFVVYTSNGKVINEVTHLMFSDSNLRLLQKPMEIAEFKKSIESILN